MRVYNREEEFNNEAIVYVARMTFDVAVDVISGGNVADESQQVLYYLLEMAKEKNLTKESISAIATYYNMVLDENANNLIPD